MSLAAESRAMRVSTSAAACVLLWMSRTVLALFASYPLLLAVRATSMTAGPEGDAVLFQPGSLMLLELLRLGGPSLFSAGEFALVLLGVFAILELIPLAMALDLLALPNRALRERLARAIQVFPRFLALGLLTLLLQAALLLASNLLTAAVKPVLASADERLQSLLPIALMGLGLMGCGWVGAVLDIARATVVTRTFDEVGARAAFAEAVNCLRQKPLRVLVGPYPSVAGSALAVLAATWFSARSVAVPSSSAALAFAFVTHQVAMLFSIAWRVRWLNAALELSAECD